MVGDLVTSIMSEKEGGGEAGAMIVLLSLFYSKNILPVVIMNVFYVS